MHYRPGDFVEAFSGSNGTLGTAIVKYSSQEEMLEKMDHMEKRLNVITE